MENLERISRIEELLQEINPLNYQRTILDLTLRNTKEKFFKEYKDEDRKILIDLENQLNVISENLDPKFAELRTLQCVYRLEYEGQVFDPILNAYRWNHEIEVFYLKNCCPNVNTWINGWQYYAQDACFHSVYAEIHQVIFMLRYSNFHILNIERI